MSSTNQWAVRVSPSTEASVALRLLFCRMDGRNSWWEKTQTHNSYKHFSWNSKTEVQQGLWTKYIHERFAMYLGLVEITASAYCQTSMEQRITPVLRYLHCLPIPFMILLLVYKSLNGLVPQYILCSSNTLPSNLLHIPSTFFHQILVIFHVAFKCLKQLKSLPADLRLILRIVALVYTVFMCECEYAQQYMYLSAFLPIVFFSVKGSFHMLYFSKSNKQHYSTM